MLQVRSEWDGPQIRGGGLTLHHFNNLPADAQACVDAVEDFWTIVLGRTNSGNGVTISSTVSQIDAATGTLQAVVGVSSPGRQAGALAQAALPPATQGPLTLNTTEVRNGRVIRGRIFMPAQTETDNDGDGTTSTTWQTTMESAGTQLADDLTAVWSVWSRPVAGSGGVLANVEDTTAGEQWWVLTSRRD
jgi:hypothetical protein